MEMIYSLAYANFRLTFRWTSNELARTEFIQMNETELEITQQRQKDFDGIC